MTEPITAADPHAALRRELAALAPYDREVGEARTRILRFIDGEEPIRTASGLPWAVDTAHGMISLQPAAETYPVWDGGRTAPRPMVITLVPGRKEPLALDAAEAHTLGAHLTDAAATAVRAAGGAS